jgi:hypothetical protein
MSRRAKYGSDGEAGCGKHCQSPVAHLLSIGISSTIPIAGDS